MDNSAEKVSGFCGLNTGSRTIYEHCIKCVCQIHMACCYLYITLCASNCKLVCVVYTCLRTSVYRALGQSMGVGYIGTEENMACKLLSGFDNNYWAKLMYPRFPANGDHPGPTTTNRKNTRHAHPDFHQDLHIDGEYCVE